MSLLLYLVIILNLVLNDEKKLPSDFTEWLECMAAFFTDFFHLQPKKVFEI